MALAQAVAVDELLKKVPPHSIEAERSVLGALLLDAEAADLVAQSLKAEHFYREAHGTIYATILELRNEKGQPADLILLKHALERKGVLESVGGAADLADIVDSVPTAANVEHYANIVREKALLRGVLRATGEIQRDVYESAEDTSDVLDRAERRLFDVTQKRITTQAVSLGQCLQETFDRISLLRAGKGERGGVMSHLVDLDNITQGFQPGELTIVAARPSMGKTSFALNLLRNACMKGGHTAVFFSLEMPRLQVASNLLCSVARVDGQALRGGFFSREEEQRLVDASELLQQQRLLIDDQPYLTTMELRAKARRLKAQEKIDLIAIDYLQLMTGSGGSRRDENRQQEVAEISRTLKAIARELSIPVIALAQLSRKVEDRTDKKPRMADLRESGAIEQDADLILLLHRDEYFFPDKEEVKNRAQVIVAKNRNGPTGEVELMFLRQFMAFDSLANR